MSQAPTFDAGIPVLTEVFRDDAPSSDPGPAAPPAPFVEPIAGLAARPAPAWSEAQLGLLERRLGARILEQLQGRVDDLLEQHLRASIEAALTGALAGLAGELRADLHDTLGHIVAAAVADELAQLQTPENQAPGA